MAATSSEKLLTGLEAVHRGLRIYRFSLLTSLLIIVAAVSLLTVHGPLCTGFRVDIHKIFTVLVVLVSVDAISLILFAMWIVDSVELLDEYLRFCRKTGRCVRFFRGDEILLVKIVDYSIWLIILYVVGVTFTTSAAYIVMVLVKYGYIIGGSLTYEEGVLASNLLYILGLILGSLSSLLMILLWLRLGEYIGVRTLFTVALLFSLKYLVDLVSLVYDISLAASVAGIMVTGLLLRYVGKLFKGLSMARRYIAELENT